MSTFLGVTTAGTQESSLWRGFLESIRDGIVNPARKSFRRAHAVSPAALRVLTYPLAAVYTLMAWMFVLVVLSIVLGVLALIAWATGGSMASGQQVDREAARAKVQAAKEEKARQKAENLNRR